MSDKPKKKMGAPTKKTEALIAAICAGLAIGKSSRAMCIEVGISQFSLWKWLEEDKNFSERYARAKEIGIDYMAEDLLEIADDGSNDWMENHDKDNVGYSVNGEHIQRSRLRVDARKWYLSKIAPKKYGDKVIAEHQGNPEQPIAHSINIRFIKSDTSAA